MKRFAILSLIICMMLASGALSSCSGTGGSGSGAGSGNAESGNDEIITDEDAMRIALERVPGATKENLTRFEMSLDEGHWLYEGEIVYKGIEYDFEIEAHNGNILKWEIDN